MSSASANRRPCGGKGGNNGAVAIAMGHLGIHVSLGHRHQDPVTGASRVLNRNSRHVVNRRAIGVSVTTEGLGLNLDGQD